MPLREALCGLLLRGPAHGYELHSALRGELGPVWDTRQSQLYLVIGRMERDGLVASRTVTQRRLPPRQVLALTKRGQRLAQSWLAAPGLREEAVLKLAVARIAAPDSFPGLAGLMAEDRAAELSQLRALRRAATGHFEKESIGFEIARCQAEIRWLGSVVDRAGEIVAKPTATVRGEHVQELSLG
jgi:PadR family transcriptional regulator AphA